MALSTGQSRVDAPTGIAARIWTGVLARTGWSGFNAAITTVGTGSRDALSGLLDAVAEGIYQTLATDARVTVTVPANAFGAGIPAAPVDVTGGRIV